MKSFVLTFSSWCFLSCAPTVLVNAQEQRHELLPFLKNTTNDVDHISTSYSNARKTSALPDLLSLMENNDCDTPLGTFPAGPETFGLIATIISQLEEPFKSRLQAAILPNLTYGVQVMKICASCKSAIEYTGLDIDEDPMVTDIDSFNRYCGEDAYASDVLHSGLAFIPLAPGGGGADANIKVGSMSTHIENRSTKMAHDEVPSAMWPPTTKFDVAVFSPMIHTMTGGVVSFAPDFTGYAASKSVGRAYLVRNSYVTATMPLWLKTKYMIEQATDCSSSIGSKVFLKGYSEGGYASIAIAEGLRTSLGRTIAHVAADGAPLKLYNGGILLANVIPRYFDYIVLLLAVTFSSTIPGLPNTDAGQDLLRPEYMNIIDWLKEDDITRAELNARTNSFMPNVYSVIVDPDIVTFVNQANDNGDTNICSETNYQVGFNDKLCDTFQENDLSEVVETAMYPITACYSETDDTVPPKFFAPEYSKNPFVTTFPIPAGTHRDAGLICYLGIMESAGGSLFLDNAPSNDAVVCPTKPPTQSPTTETPTQSPTTTEAPTTSTTKAPKMNKKSKGSKAKAPKMNKKSKK